MGGAGGWGEGGGRRGHQCGEGAGLPGLSPLCPQSVGGPRSYLALPQARRPTWGSGPGRSATARACFTSVWPPSSESSGSKDTRNHEVLVGSLKVSGHQDSKMTIIPVSRIIPYPDFQRNASSAIAVAELALLVSFGPAVLPICLPSSAVRNNCHQSCSDPGNSAFRPFAKPEIRGSRGDPLTCKVEDFWVLAGVVSWESNCMGTNEPGVFTNISFYKSWNEESAISHADLRPDFSGLFPVVLLPLTFPGLP
eukprot:bmy_09118T0